MGPTEEEDEDDMYGEVGFMFDDELPKTRREFRFGDISIAVQVVDDEAGAVQELMNGSPAAHNSNHTQSGHYIWPAAAVLCSYMMDHWQALPHGSVLELGAGVGLAGLVAAHLKGTTVVVFTDHDPGVLRMISDSIAEHQQAACHVEGGGMTDVARGGMARSRCVQLSWGHVGEEQQAALLKALNGHRPWEDDQPRSVPQQKQADYVPSVSPESKNRRVDPFFQQASGHKLNESVGVSASPQVGAETGAGSEAGGGEGEGAGEGTVPGTGAGGGPVGPVTCTQDQGDVWGGARASEGASFDLIIASDVIYSASVVAPLFRTVQDLLSPPSSPREEGKQYACHAAQSRYHSYASDPPAPCPLRRPRGTAMTTEGLSSQVVPTFLMCQSFAYDAATEETIDRACAEAGLSREVVWDELGGGDGEGEGGRRGDEGSVSYFGSSSTTPASGDSLVGGNRGGTKLQRFWFVRAIAPAVG